MCGLVGLAGNCTVVQKDVFNELLLVDVVRGHHSTGAAAIKRHTDEILMAKGPMPSPIFIGTKEYQDFIGNVGLKTLIGHNRFATVGEKTVANSHPFQFANVVGAHNGTLDTWAVKQLEDYDKFGTDSEALFNSINKIGIKATIELVSGAWALTWYDHQADTINMLRNNKRPLYYAYSADRETLFWASENHMLDWILKRHSIKLFENGIYECEADNHYRWAIPKAANGKFEKPTVAKIEGHTYNWVKDGKRHEHPWEDEYATAYGYVGANTTTSYKSGGTVSSMALGRAKPKTSKHDKKIDTKKFRPPYKDAYGRIINKAAFEALALTGCVFCDEANTSWGEFIFPLKDDMDGRKLYLCEGCYNNDEILEIVQNVI